MINVRSFAHRGAVEIYVHVIFYPIVFDTIVIISLTILYTPLIRLARFPWRSGGRSPLINARSFPCEERREISVHFSFGDTEVKASAIDHGSGRVVKASFDLCTLWIFGFVIFSLLAVQRAIFHFWRKKIIFNFCTKFYFIRLTEQSESPRAEVCLRA